MPDPRSNPRATLFRYVAKRLPRQEGASFHVVTFGKTTQFRRSLDENTSLRLPATCDYRRSALSRGINWQTVVLRDPGIRGMSVYHRAPGHCTDTAIMKHLILGAAGTGIAFGALHSIRERFGQSVYVIAIDPNPRDRVAASLYADAYVQVPLARSPEFGEALRRLAETYPGSCYLPAHDEEIEVAACLAAQGKLPAGLKLVAPPYESVRICRDKWRMYNWLRAHALPTPETVLATREAIGAVALPIIVKPRFGTASAGIRLARERADLVGLDPDRWLLQELLAAPQLSVDAFLGRTDAIFRCVCRLMESPSIGFIEARGNWRVFEDALVARQAERLARRLPLPGAFFFRPCRRNPVAG